MDIKQLLVQGFVSSDYSSKSGKLSFTVKSETIGDRLTVDGEPTNETRGLVSVALGLTQFNGNKMGDITSSLPFLSKLSSPIVVRVKNELTKVNTEATKAVADWVSKFEVPTPDVDAVVTKALNGERVTALIKEADTGFSVELQTLTIDEEQNAAVGYDFDNMTPKDIDSFRFEILSRGIKSFMGKSFSDPNALMSGLRAMPYQMLPELFNLHLQFSRKVRGILEDDANF